MDWVKKIRRNMEKNPHQAGVKRQLLIQEIQSCARIEMIVAYYLDSAVNDICIIIKT